MLLSASLSVLQQMVDICEQEMTYLDIKFNTEKPMVLRIGRPHKRISDNICLCGVDLQFVSTYLGVSCQVYQRHVGIYVKSLQMSFSLVFLNHGQLRGTNVW